MSVGRRMAESFQTSVRVKVHRASNRASGEIGHRSTGRLSFEGKTASQQSQAEVKFRGAGAVAKRVYSHSPGCRHGAGICLVLGEAYQNSLNRRHL